MIASINITITKVTENDIPELQFIGRKTFIETFSWGNTNENMQAYLNKAFSEKQLKIEINNENSEWYFAKIENEIVAYMKINVGSAQTELHQDTTGLEIERIYVLEEFQRKKIGQYLLNRAFDIAKKKKLNYLWLGVWEKNPKAIAFYKKNNFVHFDKHTFKVGKDNQTDLLMKKELT